LLLLESHDTEQIELRNHNGALFVLLYQTIYARNRLRNLVSARQNVLYSINFLGTGGVTDVIAASLSQMGRLCPLWLADDCAHSHHSPRGARSLECDQDLR